LLRGEGGRRRGGGGGGRGARALLGEEGGWSATVAAFARPFDRPFAQGVIIA